MSYKHFTRKQRNFIEENLKLGYSRRYIAKKLGRHHSSVCDEINRNSDKNGEYKAFHTDFGCTKRRVYRKYTSKDTGFLIEYIKEKILLTWSPEQISNRLGTFLDRKSRFVLISLLANGTAEEFNYGNTKKFLHIPKNKRKTFTCDNGEEFAEHIELSQILELKTYFIDKYAPWQKPSNENTNGLIREFYPKKFDFSIITQEDVDRVAELINNRPRKCLGSRTALEVFFNLLPRITR